MPRIKDIKKVLVIGSGPIVIGQAAEFDYAGTQACRSLKEEGVEVVLLNSNPATIMTDKDIADRVYIEPLTVEVVEQLIKKENYFCKHYRKQMQNDIEFNFVYIIQKKFHKKSFYLYCRLIPYIQGLFW